MQEIEALPVVRNRRDRSRADVEISQRTLVGLLVLAGCGAADRDSTEAMDTTLHARGAPALASRDEVIPTLDEFAESAHQRLQVGDSELDFYVLEGDIIVDYAMVVAYYEARYLPVQEKGVGLFPRPNGPFSPNTIRRTSFPIRYCFDNTFNATQLSQAISAMGTATATWGAVASVSFQHVSSLNGASCTQQQSGKDVYITRSTAVYAAPFPTQPNQIMRMLAPANAASMLHEIGHMLGLAHEQYHTQSGLNCTPENFGQIPTQNGIAYRDLGTSWDSASVMQYLNASGQPACSSGGTNAVSLSAGDGNAARYLYGPGAIGR